MSVVLSYAKALYEAIQEKKLGLPMLKQVETELELFIQLMKESKEIQTLLVAPTLNIEDKLKALYVSVQELQLNEMTKSFLAVIIKRNRIRFLGQIVNDLNRIRLEQCGEVCGELISTEPIAEAYLEKLADQFSKKLGKKVSFDMKVDPNYLSGIRVTLHGVTYDATLRGQLNRMHNRLKKEFIEQTE